MKTPLIIKISLFLGISLSLIACEEEEHTTLKSPVQAVTTLLEKSDGTVEAELVLISTNDANNHVFVNEATNVVVRVPTVNPTEVPLNRTANGTYTTNSTNDIFLEYVEGETYQFKFDLDSSAAGNVTGGNFVAVMDAPTQDVTFTYTELPSFDGDSSTISWTPTNFRGIFTIRDSSNNIVYKNFDFSNPSFTSDKWARIAFFGSQQLGTDIYRTPGDYSIEFCGVQYTAHLDNNLSAELGVLSGFLIGKCAAPFFFTVPD